MVDERTDLSRGANTDVIATDVSRRGENIPRILNVCNQQYSQLGETKRPARDLNWHRVIRNGGTVFTGDFYSHSK